MLNEKYKRFLEKEAEKNPIKIEEIRQKEQFRLSWEKPEEKPVRTNPSDIIESIYLGRDMEEAVVVERRVAAMLRDRLKGLEEENINLRNRLKIMKIVIGALLLALTFVFFILLRMSLPSSIIA